MKKIVSAVDLVVKWVLIFLMGASVLNVLWQVFTRFILNHPSSWTEELARYMLIWVSLLGAAYATRLKMHLSIDVLTERLTGRLKCYSQMAIYIGVLFFAVMVMIVGGIRLVDLTLSLNQISAALNVKLGYVYSIVPVSGLLIAFYALVFILENIQEVKTQSPTLS